MPIISNTVWLEVIALALAVSLLEGALTGKMRKKRRRYWLVPMRLRPVFGVVGFSMVAFILIDAIRRFLQP